MKSSHGDDGSDEASMSSDDEEYDPGKDPDAAWGDQDGKPDIRANKVARKIRKPKGKGLQLEEDDDEIVHETTDVPSTKNGSSPPKEMKINESEQGGPLAVVDNANNKQPQESRDGDTPPKSEAPKRTAIDDIWASMNKPIPVKKKKKAPVAFDSSWISQPSSISQTAGPKPGSLDILTDSRTAKPSTHPKEPKVHLDDAHPKPATSKVSFGYLLSEP
mmetsp:Transcript_8857/g.39240  ORF Transcript_8857/g.39240 Transcript_8857/m.39240 type:complete len:218 (-) Transcript_8857:137-790(-)